MKHVLGRSITILCAVVALVLGFDYATYATTGNSLILGAVNSTKHMTTLRNSGSGSVLNLQTSSVGAPPLTTNGKGLVANLNSQYLDGLNASQIVTQATAQYFDFNRTAQAQSNVTINPATVSFPPVPLFSGLAVESAPLASSAAYHVTGTFTFSCNPNPGNYSNATGYGLTFEILSPNGIDDRTNAGLALQSCGHTTTIDITPTLNAGDVIVMGIVEEGTSTTAYYPPLTFAFHGAGPGGNWHNL